jgi:hypothetical protein
MIYVTLDHDDLTIAENAAIYAMPDVASALAWAKAHWLGWDTSNAYLTPGRFGDAWLKTFSPATVANRIGPFDLDAVHVLSPGEHPGGRAHWVQPKEDVYVLMGVTLED